MTDTLDNTQKTSCEEAHPRTSRPRIPGYGIPDGEEGMLSWSYVCERMYRSMNYWVATTSSAGQPHATPVWGVWLDNCLYFDGSPGTRRGRNIAANHRVAVHLESGDEAVMMEGEVYEVKMPSPGLGERLAKAYSAKYSERGYTPDPHAWDKGGLYRVTVKVAFAWTKFPDSATRFEFD
jgi:nitroimidazol reductase NimA-like FMN-containing flavoprotein (pyridoxamine 5'-phosphate oxidase superfamily)